jgi:ribosomal protein S18 acetylase RimI-like enzyme
MTVASGSAPQSDHHNARRDRATPSILIRTMRLQDLAKVFDLGEELFTAEKWPALYRTWDEFAPVEFFASDGEFCLVAVLDDEEEDAEEDDEQVVGFCLGTLLEKRHSAWSYGYLVWMGVDPTLKGRGIGRRLLAALTDLFVENGARMMLVDTAADNEGALTFFHSQGFGHELEHVYLSRNLDKHPKAVKRRAALPRRPRSRKGPTPTEIITPATQDSSLLDDTPL